MSFFLRRLQLFLFFLVFFFIEIIKFICIIHGHMIRHF